MGAHIWRRIIAFAAMFAIVAGLLASSFLFIHIFASFIVWELLAFDRSGTLIIARLIALVAGFIALCFALSKEAVE